MKLVELTNKDKQEYNNFIATQESGSFLQSWEWGEWQSALGRQVKRLKLKVESGETAGVIQLIKMPLAFGKYYLYAPYGPVMSGQWTVDSGQFFSQLQSKFSSCVFIRIEPKDKSFFFHLSSLVKTTNIQPAKTLIINLTKTEEDLLANMHPKTRYNIRLARKHGVEIQDEFDISVGNGLFVKEAVELIVQTSKRRGYKGYNDNYYEKMINFFALQNRSGLKLHIYKAIYMNKLLSSAIIFDFENTRAFLFGGSSEDNKNVMAPYLMHYKAMIDAKHQGIGFYDFWGLETSKGEIPGFVKFKLGFGGEEKQYLGAFDFILQRRQYWVYKNLRGLRFKLKNILHF